MTYGAVLFDMDGVVIDTQAAVIAFWELIAARYQVKLTQEQFDTAIYGRPCGETLDAVFPHLTPDERADVFTEEQAFETSLTYTAMPGVTDLLNALRQNAIPTALVTSGEQWKVDEVLRQLGIGDLFTVYVTAENIPQGKPDPACYVLAAQRMHLPAARCLVFEDSISGVQAAVAAGTCCIGVRPARTAPVLLAEGARCVIPDFGAVRLEHTGGLILRITQSTILRLNEH